MSPLINKLVERVYFRGLVFNQSWEDPRMDREALQVVPDRDTVLSITSGGCNCLNLLCLNPKEIFCIDANPVQTYLLDLKLAGIRKLDYDDFFDVFGARSPERSNSLYYSSLREALPPAACSFWDQNIRWFQKGIFAQGKLGLFMRILRFYLRLRLSEQTIRNLFKIENLDEQKEYYFAYVYPKFWHDPLLRILNSRLMIYLAGMHPNQYNLINKHLGMEQYIRERVENVLTRIPSCSNYFLAQAALGEYLDNEHVPPYLQEANFLTLKRNVDRVSNVTGWLSAYLDQKPEGSIDKFCLLDIFDWMDPQSFRTTLSSVVRVGSENGRFIYRSTIQSLPVPQEIAHMVVGEPDLAQRLFERDRSGVYSSFYIYRICKNRAAREEE